MANTATDVLGLGDNIYAIDSYYARLAVGRRKTAEKDRATLQGRFDDAVSKITTLIDCAKQLGLPEQNAELARLTGMIEAAKIELGKELDRLMPAAEKNQATYTSTKENVSGNVDAIINNKLPKLADVTANLSALLLADVPAEATATSVNDPVSVAIDKLINDLKAQGIRVTTQADKKKVKDVKEKNQADYTKLRNVYLAKLKADICSAVAAKAMLDTYLNESLPNAIEVLMRSLVSSDVARRLARSMENDLKLKKEKADRLVQIGKDITLFRANFSTALTSAMASVTCCQGAGLDLSQVYSANAMTAQQKANFADLLSKYADSADKKGLSDQKTKDLRRQLDAMIKDLPIVNKAQLQLELLLVEYKATGANNKLDDRKVKDIRTKIEKLSSELVSNVNKKLVELIRAKYGVQAASATGAVDAAIEAAVKPIRDSIKDNDPYVALKKEILQKFIARMRSKMNGSIKAVLDSKEEDPCNLIKALNEAMSALNLDPLIKDTNLLREMFGAIVYIKLVMCLWVEFKWAIMDKFHISHDDLGSLLAKLDRTDDSPAAVEIRRDFTAFATYTGVNILDPIARDNLLSKNAEKSPRVELTPNPKSLKDNPNKINNISMLKGDDRLSAGEIAVQIALITEMWKSVEGLVGIIRGENASMGGK